MNRATEQQANLARGYIRQTLSGFPWVRGIGTTKTEQTPGMGYAVLVYVQNLEHVRQVYDILGRIYALHGRDMIVSIGEPVVPIVVDAVDDFVASPTVGHERRGFAHHCESPLVVPHVGSAVPYGFFDATWNVPQDYRWNRDYGRTPWDLDLFWATYASTGTGPYFYRVDDHDADMMDERGFSSVMAVPYISARDSRENPPWSQFGYEEFHRHGDMATGYGVFPEANELPRFMERLFAELDRQNGRERRRPFGGRGRSPFGEDSRAYPGGLFGGRRRGAAFGTVLGLYSVAELNDLLKAKDVEMAAIGARVAASKDPSIQSDWAALLSRYKAAKAQAQTAISQALQTGAGKTPFSLWNIEEVIGDTARSLLPDNMNATPETNAAYAGILSALQKTPGIVSPGDKQDIGNRLIAAGWKPKYKVPQPEKKSDVDVAFYQDTSDLHIPKFHIPTWVWVGGAAALGLLGYTAIRVGLVAAKATPAGALLLK